MLAGMAPEWEIAEWLNGEASLAGLRGRVIAFYAFQIGCIGCTRYALPQAQEIALRHPDVAVVGLHTVFENHAAQDTAALRRYLDEQQIRFPVGVDRDGLTLERYGMQGTPTTVLIDRYGRRRMQRLGPVADAELAAALRALLNEA